MLYNIYRGGEGRLDALVAAVREARPDILGVLEVIGWGINKERILKQFSKSVALTFSQFIKSNTRYDLAMLSSVQPLRQQELREGFWHSALLSVYQCNPIGQIAILLMHLNPRSEHDRLAELTRVVNLLASYPNAIIMGDLNSLSPYDPYNREELLARFREVGLTKFGDTALQFDCISFLEQYGYCDVMRLLGKPFVATVPTPANTDPAHAAPLRLDYMFVSKSITPFLTDAQVIRSAKTNRASDHYPLVVDFSFNILTENA